MDKRALAALVLAAAACQVRASREAPSQAPTLADVAAQARRDPWATPLEPFGRAPEPSAAAEAARDYDPSAPEASIVGGPSPAEPITLPTAPDVVAAMHGAALSILTLTDDGRSAVSADVAGSVRLWPRLDGTREPIVVRVQPPAQLALARDGKDFVIAAVDNAGQLELVRTLDSGRATSRLAIDAQRPVLAVFALPSRFILLRDDHAIATVGFDGTLRGPLAADPGEHVATLAVRRDRVLAVLGTSDATRGRWVALDDTGAPRWGDRTSALPLTAGTAVLSPSGNRIAGIATNGRSLVVAALPGGRVLARPGTQDFVDPGLRPVGFLRDDLLAGVTSASGGITWWGRYEYLEGHFLVRGPVAVADGRVISDANGALIVDDGSDDPHYLGYRVGTPSDLYAYKGGFLSTDGRAIAELDDAFHTRKAYEMPTVDPTQSWYGVQLLDRSHVVAFSYTRKGSGLYCIDLKANTATLVALGGLLDYEPATRLAVMRSGKGMYVARFDPKAGAFGEMIKIPVDMMENPRIQLLDPAHARGYVMAIVSNATSAQVRIQLVKKIASKPSEGEPLEIAKDRMIAVDDEFWRTSGDTLALVGRMFPASPRLASPDRQHSVEIEGPRVTLRDAAGRTMWTVPSRGAITAHWTPDGRLVAYGAGLSELDVATGAVTRRQCGARFGLWKDAPLSSGTPTQCEAPEHF